jgi:hypothetical protein
LGRLMMISTLLLLMLLVLAFYVRLAWEG